MASEPRRIAAIDVGTNSIHMIVAELRRSGHRVVDKEKEMVQLGLDSLDGRPLSDGAIERGAAAIAKMADVARGWKVDDIVAVATSAVREAPNRRDFLRRVKELAGIKVRVISGEEEADYIYRAVRAAVDLEGGTALCIDIGGGSVEFVIGTAAEIYFTASEPLGSLRLAQQFHLQDVATGAAINACRRFVVDQLRKVQKKVRRIGVDQCIGTSGTIQALANLAAPSTDTNPAVARTLTRDGLSTVLARLAGTTARERVERLAIDEKRAATIVAGATVLAAIMDALRLTSLLVCSVGIREGILESQLGAANTEEGRSKRRLAVAALARRSDCDDRHSRHVAQLAARIFDQTASLHGMPDDRRELLEYAALLHEVGMHVSDRGYHKHTYYVVRHATLRGFTEQQLIVVANVARYHRKAAPRGDHENLGELTAEQRAEIEKLAAILRIAEALDRSHRQAVRDVAVRSNGRVKFLVRARADASVELAAAAKRARYFSELFERKVRFHVL